MMLFSVLNKYYHLKTDIPQQCSVSTDDLILAIFASQPNHTEIHNYKNKAVLAATKMKH